jgi:hypothetical protein
MADDIPEAQPPPADPLPVPPWRWRHNPLRRPTDVLRAWCGLVVLLAAAVAAPVTALLVDAAVHRHHERTALEEGRTLHRTTAVLVHDAPRHPEPGSAEARHARYPVDVRFTDAHGHRHTGRTDVMAGAAAGETVAVWLDGDGRITDPPLTPDEARDRAVGWAVLAALAVVLGGAGVHKVVCTVLDRRNLAAWAREWAETAPRWSARG